MGSREFDDDHVNINNAKENDFLIAEFFKIAFHINNDKKENTKKKEEINIKKNNDDNKEKLFDHSELHKKVYSNIYILDILLYLFEKNEVDE